MKNKVHLIDNMEFMKTIPDNYFELAIVDPPYGIDVTKMNMGGRKRAEDDKKKSWDSAVPTIEYFNELFRISKNQVIWGGNYFDLKPSQYFCIWDKGESIKGRSFAEGEYAWVSSGGTRTIKAHPNQIDRVHPTQKPIKLYKEVLKNYAKPGDKIFDSHVGSGSIRIACHDMGFDFEGCEIDPDYYKDQEERFKKHTQQGDLFSGVELQESIYHADHISSK